MNPNFKHIVKKLKLGSHKGGSPFPFRDSGNSKNKGKKTDWNKLYGKRDMNLYGDLSLEEFKAESNRQIGGGKVPKTKMKGAETKKSGKDWGKGFLDMAQPGYDKVTKRQRQDKIDKEVANVAEKHYKDEADRKAKEAFDNKTIKEHRADKRATRDKFRGSGRTDADKLEKIRSLGESKRGIKNIKENKKIAKLAARKGISEEEATKLRGERKQKGRDFWRNFASQLTHGVNVAGGGNFDTEGNNKPTTLSDVMQSNQDKKNQSANRQRGETPEEIERNAGNEMRFDTNINKLNLSTDNDNKNIQNAGYGLGSYSPKDYIPEWNTGSPENDHFNKWKKSQSLFNKLSDDEGDSTPQTAMRKIYNQKRGY